MTQSTLTVRRVLLRRKIGVEVFVFVFDVSPGILCGRRGLTKIIAWARHNVRIRIGSAGGDRLFYRTIMVRVMRGQRRSVSMMR